jgi:uncharacterized protein (DUF2235 family)
MKKIVITETIGVWKGDEVYGDWETSYSVEHRYANRFMAWLDGWNNVRRDTDGTWYSPYGRERPVIIRYRGHIRRFFNHCRQYGLAETIRFTISCPF